VALAVVASAPVVAWTQIGDLSTASAEEASPDHFIQPVDLPAPLPALIEAVALLILVVGIGSLAWQTKRGRLGLRGWLALGLAVFAGFLLGLFARVMTAAVIGANIAAGFAVAAVFFLVLPLYAASLVAAVRRTASAEDRADSSDSLGRIE